MRLKVKAPMAVGLSCGQVRFLDLLGNSNTEVSPCAKRSFTWLGMADELSPAPSRAFGLKR